MRFKNTIAVILGLGLFVCIAECQTVKKRPAAPVTTQRRPVAGAASCGGAAHCISLSWNASTDLSNPPAAGSGYYVYKLTGTCPATATGFTKLTTTLVTTLNYVDATVVFGSSYCYYVTAFSTNESMPSNMAGGTVSGGGVTPATPQNVQATVVQ